MCFKLSCCSLRRNYITCACVCEYPKVIVHKKLLSFQKNQKTKESTCSSVGILRSRHKNEGGAGVKAK